MHYKLVKDFFHRSFEIPEDWDYPKFSKVVIVNPTTKIDEKQVPYLPMDAIDTERPHFNYFEERNLSDFSSLPKFQENDVLFASITPSTENGKTCIIENFSRKGIGSSELTVLRPTEEIIPRYLYYYVKSHRIRQFAISQMMGTTGRQRVPDYVFKKDLNFELPTKSEQQKIASILSNVDSMMQHTQKEIERTRRIKKGLMQRLLTKGIGHTKFKKLRIGAVKYEIPEEWKKSKLEDLSSKIGDGLHATPEYVDDSNFYFINGNNLNNGKIVLDNAKNVDENEYLKYETNLNDNTVLLSINGTIGNVAFYTNEKVILGKSVCYINCTEKLSKKFLFYFLQSDHWNKYITKELTSTTIFNLSLASVRNLLIPAPKISEQQKIASILSNVDSLIQKQQEYKSKLETLKKGLMQKLLTGQIRVKV